MTRGLWFALATVAFGTSYALLPLYSSNQNHHFLIGLARAGEGSLANDWMAGTVDPFPVFTAFVEILRRFHLEFLHYVVYYLLLAAYAYGLIRLVELVLPDSPESDRRVQRLAFLAALCLLHNDVVGYLVGIDLAHMPWWQMTHWGVAEQEIFGHGAFQASAFGLLLPLALAWFLDRRPIAATALMGSVLAVHFGDVLTIAALTVAFMAVEARRSHRWTRSLAIGVVALVFAVPTIVDLLARLRPASREISTTAANILVAHLPQAAVPDQWLGTKAYVQMGIIFAGLVLSSGTELLPILTLPLLAGVMLSAAQVTSGNPQLALLFPWRVSALLVPVSTALVVRFAIATFLPQRAGPGGARMARRVVSLSTVALMASCVLSAARMTLNFAYFYDYRPITDAIDRAMPPARRPDLARLLRPATLPMMQAMRSTAVRGDLFVIPPELERFRLVAGAPILADLNSHPYKDVEVIEWKRRLDLVRSLYASAGDCRLLSTMVAEFRITHVVADARIRPVSCAGWSGIYEDEVFAVYRLDRSVNTRLDLRPLPLTSAAGFGARDDSGLARTIQRSKRICSRIC